MEPRIRAVRTASHMYTWDLQFTSEQHHMDRGKTSSESPLNKLSRSRGEEEGARRRRRRPETDENMEQPAADTSAHYHPLRTPSVDCNMTVLPVAPVPDTSPPRPPHPPPLPRSPTWLTFSFLTFNCTPGAVSGLPRLNGRDRVLRRVAHIPR